MQLRRLITLLVIMVLLIYSMPMLALPVSAAWYKDGYYTYSVTDGKATIEDVDTAISGSITTPATLGGYPVVEIADDAFSRCNNLTSVTVSSSVTFIGKRAFANCANLTTLVIPNGASITNASWQICEYCPKLTNVTLGNGICVIPQWAFQYCTSLSNIIIPNGVTNIYMAAFANCTNLTTVTLPVSVRAISSQVFDGCTGLTSVYYGGTEAQRENIEIQLFNQCFETATWYYSYTPISITRQPSSVTVADGQTATVSFSASGNGLTYKWYYKDKTAGSFTRDTGFSGNSYSVTMSAAVDGRRVYCIVTDTYGKSVQTNTVTLSRKVEPVKITKQPENVTVAAGETAATTFTASGDGLSYQWYCKKKGDAYFSADNSTSGNTYHVIMDVHSDGKQVYCIVTDQYGNRA